MEAREARAAMKRGDQVNGGQTIVREFKDWWGKPKFELSGEPLADSHEGTYARDIVIDGEAL